jgi:hypothetical protein
MSGVTSARIAPPGASNDRCAVQYCRNPVRLKCRRHYQQSEVRADRCLDIERQGKPQIGFQAAFVKFIKNHG